MKSDRKSRNYPGSFITLEGPEGAGKSSQLAWLGRELGERGCRVVATREPGGTPLAERLRGLIKHGSGEPLTPVTELLLLEAARAQHVAERIAPALLAGEVVICDRFMDSTLAYQGGGRGLEPELIERLNQAAVGRFRPDLTILLDLPVEEGFVRTRKRALESAATDRFESQELDFHRRVRECFLQLARREPERIRVVDARPAPDVVHQAVMELVNELF